MKETNYWKNKWLNRPCEPANSFARRAYKLIEKKKLKTLLDLGCGDGRDAVFFADKGLAVTAVDFSESGLNKLKAKNGKIKCLLKDIRKMNFNKNSFEVIFAHLSLQYFDDRTTEKIFEKAYRILKKGGLFFVKCKSADDPLFGQGKKIGENMYRKGHLRHFFTQEYMAEKLRKFKIIKLNKTSSVYHEYKSSFIEAVATK